MLLRGAERVAGELNLLRSEERMGRARRRHQLRYLAVVFCLNRAC